METTLAAPSVDLDCAANPGRLGGPLVWVFAAVALGIVADRYLPRDAPIWWTCAAIAWAGSRIARRRRYASIETLLLLVAAAGLAASWHHARWNLFTAGDLGRRVGGAPGPVAVEVVARTRPRLLPAPPDNPLRSIDLGDRCRMEVDVVAVRDRLEWEAASGQATLLVSGHLPGVHAGDRLRVFAELASPIPSRNPGQFDFARHARANRQLSVLRAPYPDCVVIVDRPPGSGVRRALEALRSSGDRLLSKYVASDNSGLAAAVLLGERDQAGAETTDAFIATGTIHLLVVSGLHVSILAMALWAAMRLGLVRRPTALWLLALSVVAYAALTGGRPPVMRAAVLVVIVCIARLKGHPAWSLNSLAAAALVVLAVSPADLFRAGPQLSFLAVAALIALANRTRRRPAPDPLDRLIAASRPKPIRAARYVGRWYAELTLASIVVWLVALPLVMLRFHLFSPIAVVLSPLLWFPLAVSLLSGFVVLLTGWLLPPVAIVSGWICNVSLQFMSTCVDAGNRIPGNHVWVDGPTPRWVLGFYVGLALATVAHHAGARRARNAALALWAVWIAVGLVAAWKGAAPEQEVRGTFVSIDHGCAVLVELPDGSAVLYDAGRLGSPHAGVRAISNVLWARGKRRLDAVVLSHADADHYNTLPELLTRFDVAAVYVGPSMFRDADTVPALAALRDAIQERAIPLHVVAGGDVLPLGGPARLRVLHPPVGGVADPGVEDNARSVVLAIDYAGRRLLLPGDLEARGLDLLTTRPPLDCDVLLAPHHGSIHSEPTRFAAWSRPEWLVVSGGANLDLAATRAVYEASGARVFHTARDGAVEVTLRADGVEVRTWGVDGWRSASDGGHASPVEWTSAAATR